ncbi:C40 family peptidase [Streptomyces sp. NBC_00572]|uniref:C40 family peptidase n=1 Tax=Streptomyces sp. NBC_00572 TaxID=2903664 RepID=UPI0022529DB8|nr:C40 family peptidase [Streptomyces sp. NBC_00572]MCX4983448.1 C40 family peptidase [Streptomyces sp. NBC_00572]
MSRRLLRTVCAGALAAATALTGVAPAGATAAPEPPVDPPVEAPIAWADPAAEPVEPVDPAAKPVEPADPADPADPVDPVDPVEPVKPVGTADPEAAPTDPAPPAPPAPPEASESSPADDASALPPPGGDSVTALLTRMRTLYRQTEEATERFNAAEEALRLQTADTKKVTARLTAARTALAQGRAAAGRIAREQYQGRSEFSSYLRLLFSPDPQSALDQGHLMARASRDRATAVPRLEKAERQAGTLASASRKALDRQQTLAAAQRTRRDEVRARLAEVEKLLAGLSPEQLARLTELERVQTAGAQRELLDSGVLDGRRTPSGAGADALRFAVGQIGKPYEWGAEGPETYDCSGLTQQAWASAGRELPRTSQEQWATLPRVPLAELRPGDLVVYFPGATHVAVYLGEGLVVQAPRPGGKVKVSPIAANPLLGAVRPDPDGEALAAYTPPVLPAGAREGGDEGYDNPDGSDGS